MGQSAEDTERPGHYFVRILLASRPLCYVCVVFAERSENVIALPSGISDEEV